MCRLPEEMPFRWSLSQDIALCEEVRKTRPEKSLQWQKIADRINDAFSTEENMVDVRGRGCKERLTLLVRKYKDEDRKSLKRSV